ncbi:MAG TPA: hypothetical protein VMG10_07255 [Gemmataceae bacterium]|nr:hypothetical protein [Gemmataceae bacterium]
MAFDWDEPESEVESPPDEELEQRGKTSEGFTRWWQYGLLGGFVLSLTTLVKVLRAVVRGAVGEAKWTEAVGFAVAIFGMGFVCGLVAWAGRGLSRRFGLVGDAFVGMVVMVVFFVACMLLFSPELLGAKWSVGGLPMLGLGAVVGLIGGVMVGQELRKDKTKQKRKR